jgi:coatomer protein complex subunit gamma
VLKFVSKEIDPSTGEPEDEGYEDEYTLEDVSLDLVDYIQPHSVPNFKKVIFQLKLDMVLNNLVHVGVG